MTDADDNYDFTRDEKIIQACADAMGDVVGHTLHALGDRNKTSTQSMIQLCQRIVHVSSATLTSTLVGICVDARAKDIEEIVGLFLEATTNTYLDSMYWGFEEATKMGLFEANPLVRDPNSKTREELMNELMKMAED